MRHRLVPAIAVLALALVPGALAAGPDLGTTGSLVAGKVRYTTNPNSDTSLAVRSAAGGEILRQASIPGQWGIPKVTLNGAAGGLSHDGSTLVLAQRTNIGTPLRSETRFVTVDTRKLAVTRTIKLKGDFAFDALSPNGRTLYLIEHFSQSDLSRYRVRAYDLKSGRLLPGVIVDKRNIDEPMSGYPMARASTADGRRVYTLYSSSEHPFVHLLDTVSRTAFCIDLPSAIETQAIQTAIMKLTNGGRSLTIIGARGQGPRHVVDTKTLRVT